MTDEELLQLQMCDLPLSLENSNLQGLVDQLLDELAGREIRHQPHCWLSDGWYSPNGVPGIAIPFYLAHPRLIQLERKQLGEAEGGSYQSCMKILRHEAGHVVDTAYRLSRRKRYREAFGKATKPYPEFYQPRPRSKNYVRHLAMWYAQSHPVEDFAETFAVWLPPRARWRSNYRDWPAFKKLEVANDLITDIQGKKPLVTSRRRIDPFHKITKTLEQHYATKRIDHGVDRPSVYDKDLRRLFSEQGRGGRTPSAGAFLSRSRRKLCRPVAKWVGDLYATEQVLSEIIVRCRELKLQLNQSPEETLTDMALMLAVQTVRYLNRGDHRISL